MATDKYEIDKWFRQKKNQGYAFMLVVCDTFDYEDYPVGVKADEDVNKKIAQYSKDMQQVMEVYNLNEDLEKQLNQSKAWNTKQ